MKIVVLAGGTSTEREISIVSGTGICGALRQKGHEAILVDIFCGVENVDWENPFPAEYEQLQSADQGDGEKTQKLFRTKCSGTLRKM